MDYTKVLKRALGMVWRYRALWIFGAVLALTTVNGFYFGSRWDQDEAPRGIPVKLTEDSTIYLPGEGLTIDLTEPRGISIKIDEGEWRDLKALSTHLVLRDIKVILIATGIVLTGMIVLGIISRYVAEAALIRMVSETEETGERLSMVHGLRLGFSRSAWRLFVIDLVISLPVTMAFLVLFLGALSPLLLWTSGSTLAGITGTVFSTGLLFLLIPVAIIVKAALSLLIQVFRRACAVEQLGVFAAIRRGFVVARHHLKEVGIVWIIWIGMRLLWMLAMVPVMIVILPVTLLFILVGAVAGGMPAVLVGGVLSLFYQGALPWIVGGIVGLSLFILAMIAPMLFLSGLVEVIKSSTWTLTYRELRAQESWERAPAPGPDAQALEAAPVA